MGRDDEWDIGVGLRKAAIHLLLWGVVCLVVWAGVVWLVTPWLDALPSGPTGSSRVRRILAGVIALPIAAMCVHLLYKKMIEAAGFTSMILSIMAIVCVWAIAIGGAGVANALRPPEVSSAMLWMCLAPISMVWILYETFADR